jgi:hypothetical protein
MSLVIFFLVNNTCVNVIWKKKSAIQIEAKWIWAYIFGKIYLVMYECDSVYVGEWIGPNIFGHIILDMYVFSQLFLSKLYMCQCNLENVIGYTNWSQTNLGVYVGQNEVGYVLMRQRICGRMNLTKYIRPYNFRHICL